VFARAQALSLPYLFKNACARAHCNKVTLFYYVTKMQEGGRGRGLTT
jgi:hypothetical protein